MEICKFCKIQGCFHFLRCDHLEFEMRQICFYICKIPLHRRITMEIVNFSFQVLCLSSCTRFFNKKYRNSVSTENIGYEAYFSYSRYRYNKKIKQYFKGIHLFLISNTFINHTRLKLTKNEANAKEHLKPESWLFQSYLHSSFM